MGAVSGLQTRRWWDTQAQQPLSQGDDDAVHLNPGVLDGGQELAGSTDNSHAVNDGSLNPRCGASAGGDSDVLPGLHGGGGLVHPGAHCQSVAGGNNGTHTHTQAERVSVLRA